MGEKEGKKEGNVKIIETQSIKEAAAVAEIVLDAESAAIGEIVGESGTGKSMAGRYLAQKHNAPRVVAYEGITRYRLCRAIAGEIGFTGRPLDILDLPPGDARRLLIVDEANKLKWQTLEVLRYLADERGWAVILIGTELYERQFQAARTRELLIQLGRRIGAKRVRFSHMDRASCAAYVIRPRFGDDAAADRAIVTRFWQASRKGNWGEAAELSAACGRIMAANQVSRLTVEVIEAAVNWAANRGGVA